MSDILKEFDQQTEPIIMTQLTEEEFYKLPCNDLYVENQKNKLVEKELNEKKEKSK